MSHHLMSYVTSSYVICHIISAGCHVGRERETERERERERGRERERERERVCVCVYLTDTRKIDRGELRLEQLRLAECAPR